MKLILVSLDTVRADRLGCLGNGRGLTPNLDRIATESALFSRVFSSDIPTQPAHTSVLSGRFGINTGIVSHFHPPARLSPDEPWLPSILQDTGRTTGAVDHLFAMKDWFSRGYTDYMPPPGRSRAPASVINQLAFPWISDHSGEDFFLFLHYWDAHIPYVPPSPFRDRFAGGSAARWEPDTERLVRARPTYPLFKRNLYDHLGAVPNLDYVSDLYDAEIAYLDHEIGQLFAQLAALRILDDSVVVLFADHGENMTEHDAWFDHAGLYDSVVHVPLLIRAPGRIPPGRIDDLVQLADVMPTALELLDLPVPPGLDGRSLVPRMSGRPTWRREMVMLSECTWQAKRGVRTDRWKYLRCYDPGIFDRAGPELYDLLSDPAEQDNVSQRYPDLARQFDRALEAWVGEQLAGRLDPLLDVVAHELPAVARLRQLMDEEMAVSGQSRGSSI